MCDGQGVPCDVVCGGAMCGRCGGVGCENGATTVAGNALALTNETAEILAYTLDLAKQSADEVRAFEHGQYNFSSLLPQSQLHMNDGITGSTGEQRCERSQS